MRPPIDFAKPFGVDMGVALRRLQRRMPQLFLDEPQVGPLFQKMGCRRMAQSVGRHVLYVSSSSQAVKVTPQDARVQSTTPLA